ncbi:hypothetical protein [Streptomyces sp. SAS_272]|uniref:hypothetical protein n=1 Tax=Streptomyces sp. SAS_272 TaxID=3412747 RepID=UPI00403C0187
MAFPTTPLDVQVDLKVAGAWQNITADVLTRDIMTITRGRPDEGARTDPGKLKLLLNNGRSKVAPAVMGRYSTGNPLSDLFGLIGRNTEVRVHLPADQAHLELDGDASGYVSTPHAAALNITGDIDLRFEFDADMTDVAENTTLFGKWGTSAATRSWGLRYYAGLLIFDWVNSSSVQFNAVGVIERFAGAAVRVTLDVDNGASGYTVRFYQAEAIDGPWTQLYGDIVGSGTTSIQSTASTPVTIGVSDPTVTPPRHPFTGTATRFQVRNGIDGTLVANCDFRGLADGATSFVDSTGLTWTVNGTADVRKRDDRIVAEISSWPPRWDVSGNDRWMAVEASGVLRRYGQGASPLQSALRRRIPASNPLWPSPLAYWPMEDGAQSTQAASPIPGVRPMSLTNVTWASADSLISSDALPVWASNSGVNPVVMSGVVPAPATASSSWSVYWVYRLDSLPATLRTFMRISTTGTVREWQVQSKDSQSKVIGTDADGTTVVSTTISTDNNIFNTWMLGSFFVSESGGTVTWTVQWTDIHGSTEQVSNTLSGTAGRVTSVGSPSGGYASELDGLALGHVIVYSTVDLVDPFGNSPFNALDGWTPELAGRRALRLAKEETAPFSVRGIIADQELMGAQRMQTLLDLLAECASSDGGILLEHRARLALRYRGRGTLYNQQPALVLDYTADGEVAPPLEPVDDDANVVNDVTVQRIDGSFSRAVLEEGPLSVQSPPNGVGRYDTSVQLSLADDAQAENIAGWRMHLGTWDAPRYPVVHVNLAAAPHLIDAVMQVDQGDLIRITNPPADLPPGDINLLVQGYTESFDQYAWDVYFTCTPADPWNVAGLAVYEDFQDSTLEVTATNGGNASWARSQLHFNSGTWSLRSGAISNNQTSDWIVTVPTGSTEMRYWYWTSSEAAGPGFAGDRLIVLVDSTQVLLAQGTTPWTQAIVDVTGAGTVTFRYAKDNSSSSGEDAVHIDDVSFTGIAPYRVDTDGSELVAAVTSSATSLVVATTPLNAPRWTLDPVQLPLDIRAGGEVMRVSAIASWATDAFGRTASGGWGSADSGQTWTAAGGTLGTDYAVGSGYGQHILTTANASRRCGIALTYPDVDVVLSLTTSATATGGSLYGGPLVRYVDADNLYMLRVEFTTGNAINLDLRKRAAAVESSLATYATGLTHVAGTFVRARLQVCGSTLRAKVWALTAVEPDWQITTTDSSVTTAAFVGARSISAAGNTNVNPQVRYDSFEVLTPQTFSSVVRAVNGIVKAQSAGAAVALADPAHIAL